MLFTNIQLDSFNATMARFIERLAIEGAEESGLDATSSREDLGRVERRQRQRWTGWRVEGVLKDKVQEWKEEDREEENEEVGGGCHDEEENILEESEDDGEDDPEEFKG